MPDGCEYFQVDSCGDDCEDPTILYVEMEVKFQELIYEEII
jgi:hypothetical protein